MSAMVEEGSPLRAPLAPGPTPLEGPLGTFALLRALRTNPVATWTRMHFERPVVSGTGVLGRVTVLSDPALIRHVLVDNAANYPKDDLQQRLLASGLGKGLLMADGEMSMKATMVTVMATGQGLDEVEIKANIVTFIAAGHETTSNALTWALYLLSQDPGSRALVEQEVDAALPDGIVGPGVLDRLVHTRAVIDETLRLYPPAATISRQAREPDRVGGLLIKAGTQIVISPWVLHRHVLLWDEPNRFQPSRFRPEARKAIDRFAYLPFGAGPRVCIGASFALQEAVTVLATLVRAFRLSLKPGHPIVPVQRISLRPQRLRGECALVTAVSTCVVTARFQSAASAATASGNARRKTAVTASIWAPTTAGLRGSATHSRTGRKCTDLHMSMNSAAANPGSSIAIRRAAALRAR